MALSVHTGGKDASTSFVRALVAVCIAACILIAAVAPSGAAPPSRKAAPKVATGVVDVSIHPAAVVTSADVTIGDVATIEGGDASIRKRIAALDLSEAPEPGKTSRLTQAHIAYRIHIAGIDARRYKVRGAESVTLGTRGYRVPEQEIVNAAKQYLLKRLPWSADDITIESTKPIRGPVQVSGGREDIRFEVSLSAPRISLGNVRVDVAILSKGTKQAEVPVTLDVHLCQTIAVAARKVDRGQTLTDEDIVFERRAVDNVAGYLTKSESLLGQKTKRAIAPLQAITKSDIDSSEPDSGVVIRQRDAVKLVARAGNLVVTATGEALQDGRSGQMIRVRNIDSKAVVSGRVVNRNEVQVLY